ncbi:hypothetical protein Tco_0379621, partial [Tanacetum coccineum]
KEDKNCIPRHLVSLVEDFDCWNDYPWGEYMWLKFYKRTVNVVADHRAFHLDKKKQNPDYYPTYNLYGFPLAFKIWILESYPNSKKWWSKKDNVLPRALAWLNDSNPNLELYATPIEQQTEWFKARIEYINGLVDMNVSEDDIGGDVSNNSFDLNDNFIPCNDRSKGNHNAVNPGLTTSANHPLSTCSRHVVDNPEVACAGTGIHNADEMYDSPNCVTDNDVNERISVSSNYSMLNTCCPEMHNAIRVNPKAP